MGSDAAPGDGKSVCCWFRSPPAVTPGGRDDGEWMEPCPPRRTGRRDDDDDGSVPGAAPPRPPPPQPPPGLSKASKARPGLSKAPSKDRPGLVKSFAERKPSKPKKISVVEQFQGAAAEALHKERRRSAWLGEMAEKEDTANTLKVALTSAQHQKKGGKMKWQSGKDSPKDSKDGGRGGGAAESTPRPAVVSLAALGGGWFLAAAGKTTGLHRLVEGAGGAPGEELVREFAGHRSAVETLAVLCGKGRFLTAGRDNTVRLWDSRFDCDDDDNEYHEHRTHLATFDGFKRRVHSIAVIDPGTFVRPTDDVDLAMFSTVMKKAALEGSAAVTRAARQMEILQCSGTFATASNNEKEVRVWELSAAARPEEEGAAPRAAGDAAATLAAGPVLEHDCAVTALAASRTRVFAGDAAGVVVLWERQDGLLASFMGSVMGGAAWTKVHQFTPWKTRALVTPKEKQAQTIVRLCVLGDGFAAGGRSGVVRVWDDIRDLQDFEVLKKEHASSVRFTAGALTGIEALPHVRDPSTGEERRALAVAASDGRMASLALCPRRGSAKNDLVTYDAHGTLPFAIGCLAVCDGGDSSHKVLVAGDVNGNINTLKLEWTA